MAVIEREPSFDTRTQAENRLMELPSLIAQARLQHLSVEQECHEAEAALKNEEAYLLADTLSIDGKNAEIRSAQLRQHTRNKQDALMEAEYAKKRSAVYVDELRDELYALNAYSRILGARSE